LRIPILITLLVVFSFSLVAVSLNEASAIGGAAGINGKIYVKNHMGDIRETGWANVTAAGELGVYSARFNAAGQYYIYLPPGTYEVTVSLPGYIDESDMISVSEGASLGYDFYLEQSGVPIPEFHEYATMLMTAVSLLLVIFIMRKRDAENRFN
jgi:hypothetical protein